MAKSWQKPIQNYKHTKSPGPSRAKLREQLAEAAKNTARAIRCTNEYGSIQVELSKQNIGRGDGACPDLAPTTGRCGVMALHEQCVGATDEWYTPPHVFNALGCIFDLDVASPGAAVTPWIPAKTFIRRESLEQKWHGFVWMNPPFGARNGLVPWLEKFFCHGNGIALVPDRTSAPWWQTFASKADGLLFITPKLKFIGADGKPGNSPAQGTTLMAAGSKAARSLLVAADGGLGIFAVPAPRSDRANDGVRS